MTGKEEDHGAAYGSFDGFLKAAIKTYWEKGGNRVHFIALLLASREAWEVAWDGVREPGTGKKILTGAAGATAVLVALRLFLGGPLGLVLTGVSLASLGALYARNHRRIWAQRARYADLISQYRLKHQKVRAQYLEGDIDDDGQNLMFDGLLRRFLDELDVAPVLADDDDEATRDEEE